MMMVRLEDSDNQLVALANTLIAEKRDLMHASIGMVDGAFVRSAHALVRQPRSGTVPWHPTGSARRGGFGARAAPGAAAAAVRGLSRRFGVKSHFRSTVHLRTVRFARTLCPLYVHSHSPPLESFTPRPRYGSRERQPRNARRWNQPPGTVGMVVTRVR